MFDPHFITKGSDVKKQASIVEVKVTGFFAEYNLPLAACPVSFRIQILQKNILMAK